MQANISEDSIGLDTSSSILNNQFVFNSKGFILPQIFSKFDNNRFQSFSIYFGNDIIFEPVSTLFSFLKMVFDSFTRTFANVEWQIVSRINQCIDVIVHACLFLDTYLETSFKETFYE